MGNSSNKSALRKSQSVPDTQKLALDAPVFDKQKSVSQLRLNQTHEKPGKPGKKHKQKIEELPQLPPAEATFLPEFPLRGDLEELDYDIIDVIARGAYGNVIKVQREDEKKFYAVKVLDKAQIIQEGAIRQCKDEATIQSMAGEHPLVVKAYEYWQSRRSLYIVLDYVPHGDMFTLWTFHGAFPENLVQLYIAEMAMVIDYLHNASVIYRDIKMENILFNAKGHIQLTDFGLAKWLQGGDQTRTVCGTLQYMAPEVLSVYPYSHSADWWSLGILMYAMLAGRYPVDGADTHTRMAQKVFECDFLLPSHISDSAQDVINRVLTKSPHKRLCDVNSLQDLDFFQGIFFSDLIEQKLNPVDVVPEDFFPMCGHSWAPQMLTDEEQGHFDQFDDSGDTLTDDEPRYPHLSHYHAEPQPSHHHPDTVHRLQPSQLYSQNQHQVHGKPLLSPIEQQLQPGQQQHRHQLYSSKSSQFSQDHKKPVSDLRGASSSCDTDLNGVNARIPSVINDRKLEPSQDYHTLQTGSSGDKQNSLPRLGYDGSVILPHKSVDGNNKEMRSNISSVRQSYGGAVVNSESMVRSNTNSDRQSYAGGGDGMNNESITRSNTNSDRQSFAGGGAGMNNESITKNSTNSDRRSYGDGGAGMYNESITKNSTNSDRRSYGGGGIVDMSNKSITRSNTSSDRRSYVGAESNNSSLIRKDNPGFVSVASNAHVNNLNSNANGSSGNINRQSTGPEYISVEAAPTVTLKTMPFVRSTQPWYSETQPTNSSQTSVINPASSLQNFVANKQTAGINLLPEEANYQTQTFNTRVTSRTAGVTTSSNIQSTDKGYKTFEVSPTITLPSQQISFSQNSGMSNDKDLQQTQPTNNNFPNNYLSNTTNLSHINSDYQRLDQRTITLNSAPQRFRAPEQPTISSKPVPAQKPVLVSKPAAPVRPIPAPRRSLRHNQKRANPSTESRVTSNQDPAARNKDPYASDLSQGQNISPCSQNTSSANKYLNHQQDLKSTPHQQIQSVTAASQGRLGSGSNINVLTGSNSTGIDASTNSPSIESQSFHWKLPAGTTPSFV